MSDTPKTASEELIESWGNHDFPDEEKIRQMASECDAQQRDAETFRTIAEEAEKTRLKLASELKAANRSLDWCGKQIDGCGKYTKEGETIAEAMERNWTDSQNALGLFAKERIRKEELEEKLSAAQAALAAARPSENDVANAAEMLKWDSHEDWKNVARELLRIAKVTG